MLNEEGQTQNAKKKIRGKYVVFLSAQNYPRNKEEKELIAKNVTPIISLNGSSPSLPPALPLSLTFATDSRRGDRCAVVRPCPRPPRPSTSDRLAHSGPCWPQASPDATEDAVSALLKRLPQRFRTPPSADVVTQNCTWRGPRSLATSTLLSVCRLCLLSGRPGSEALLSQVRNGGVNHCRR